MRYIKISFCFIAVILSGCATKDYDYTAYRASKPRSILILPPINHTSEVKASNSFMSQTTYPLAESGYYVIPVALTAETFMQNGVTEASEAHNLPTKKLREIFGADAALYIEIHNYGTKYLVITSSTTVKASARLVDLRTNSLLWDGAVYASSDEQNNSGGGIAGALISTAIKQIVKSLTDEDHKIAGVASNRMLSAGVTNGLLYGPYKVQNEQDKS